MQCKLADGRELAFAEYGEPLGKPLFFFPGAPGSRLFRPPDEITRRNGVRLICVDRPGYGGSTFQPGRTILDWPKDVAALADTLDLRSFAVAGHSAGGPYALACAYCLPERVTTAGILSAAGPIEAPGATEGMTFINWLGFKLGPYMPWFVMRAMVWWFFHRQAADPAHAIDTDQRKRAAADEEVMGILGVREICIASDVEAYRQGLLGYAWDVRLITRPWNIALEDIKVPVHLWHGTADNFVSTRMARYMEAKIPNCMVHISEGDAHMLLIPRWEEILATILQAENQHLPFR